VVFTGPFTKYLTPPSLGKCLLLGCYWTVILIMLWSNVILAPGSVNYGYKWEIVGFRAAWISVTQIPLIYCLSCKINVISLITGISYERLNWLHRWVSRTLFLTVIVHWSFFFTEWSLADFVQMEFEMMPMVKWGFASWGVMGFMVLTSFGFFRSKIYEIWVLQHIATAGLLLFLIHTHLPSYATYNVWIAIGFVAFDRISRVVLVLVRNLHIFKGRRSLGHALGYSATVRQLSDQHLHIVIDNVNFSWKAGQHIYLSIPRVGLLENHPFTIANTFQSPASSDSQQSIELYIKVRSGFTRRLYKMCSGDNPTRSFHAFVSGPWGSSPSLDRFDSLVIMATGTGISYAMPILESAVNRETRIRRLSFVWVIRHWYQLDWFKAQLNQNFKLAEHRDVELSIYIFVTEATLTLPPSSNSVLPIVEKELRITTNTKQDDDDILEIRKRNTPSANLDRYSFASSAGSTTSLNTLHGRPTLDAILRPVIEEALGETGIFACGNASFMADLRNYTASTSDERAVHKGTGAQGLYLFTQTYGW
jgi:ferredoxin-NADP reductase